MVKKSILFFFALSVSACQYVDKQVPSHDELLEKELQSIDWKQVDEHPSVSACDSLDQGEARNACFTAFLTSEVQERLSKASLKVLYPELDQMDVRVIISADSTVTFEPIWNESWAYSRQAIDTVLKQQLADFPKVFPAIKRDLPVTTVYILPIYFDLQSTHGSDVPSN